MQLAAQQFAQTPGGQGTLASWVAAERISLAESAIRRRSATEAAEQVSVQAQARRAAQRHVVYYVRLGSNHIKIGTTGTLRRRMNELRVANTANLLAVEPGGRALERERHAQFRKWSWRRGKEDFAEAPELLAHVRHVRAEHGDPYKVEGVPADDDGHAATQGAPRA